MRADTEFLSLLSTKVREIADECADIDTQQKLRELEELLVDAIGTPADRRIFLQKQIYRRNIQDMNEL